MIRVTCKECGTVFDAKPSWIKNGYGKYCSRSCSYAGNRKGKTMPCNICGKKVYKQLKALRGSKSGKFFCSKSCQTKWRNTEFVGEKHGNWKGGMYTYRRLLELGSSPQICALCKTEDVRVLAVHHIDENRKNNAVDNLAWLCHNCHHLVHHYPAEREKFMAAIV